MQIIKIRDNFNCFIITVMSCSNLNLLGLLNKSIKIYGVSFYTSRLKSFPEKQNLKMRRIEL
jgi:hypothetical protein